MKVCSKMFQMNRLYSSLVVLVLIMGYAASKVFKHNSDSPTNTSTLLSINNSTSATKAISLTIITDMETTTVDQESVELSLSEQHSEDPPKNQNYDCRGYICITKCCPNGFLKEVYGECVNVTKYNAKNWTPDVRMVNNSQLEIVHRLPKLPKEEKYQNYHCPMHVYYEFSLHDDGTVYVNEAAQHISPEFYCIDNMYDEDANKTIVAGFFCYEVVEKTPFEKTMDNVLPGTLAVSVVFLLAILVLYLLSPKKKDLQARCTISSCLSLFLGFVATIVTSTSLVNHINPEGCVAVAIAVQFFMLSFYFWLNVMCFEISRVMRRTLKFVIHHEIKSENRYLCYSAYAWGTPLIIGLITIVMQYLPTNISPEIEEYLIRPDIGEGRCWFRETGGAIYAYYYSIEIILHVMNAGFMGHATYLLYKEEVMCRCQCKDNTSMKLWTHNSKIYLATFKRQLLIFILYVFIWMLNSISLVNPRSYFWRIVDVVVALQGVFLFFIVIKPKKHAILRNIAKRVSCLAKEEVDVGSLLEMSAPPTEQSNL